MADFEQALRNIDIFCKVMVKKMVEDESTVQENNMKPIERLLRRKYIIEEHHWSDSSVKHLIPLPQLEEPLIDVFEDDNYVRILMQCRCSDQEVKVHTNVDDIEICNQECHTDMAGHEVCIDKCQKLDLASKDLQLENLNMKCNNNTAFEIAIPKSKIARSY